MLHCRRWAGRHDAGLAPRARRCRCRRPRKACRLPARLSRRHHHPSTLEIMRELGLLEDFLRLPHQELRSLAGLIGDTRITLADFTHLPTHCKFIALMPQWDFL